MRIVRFLRSGFLTPLILSPASLVQIKQVIDAAVPPERILTRLVAGKRPATALDALRAVEDGVA